MAEFIEKHWDLINWPTALVAVAILTPIAVSFFALIASYGRKKLKDERNDHKQTKLQREQLANELIGLNEQIDALTARLEMQDNDDSWRDVTLTEEERIVLIAISRNQLDRLYHSRMIGNQRIQLVLDRLEQLEFVGEGPSSHYTLPIAREWLDSKGLLK